MPNEVFVLWCPTRELADRVCMTYCKSRAEANKWKRLWEEYSRGTCYVVNKRRITGYSEKDFFERNIPEYGDIISAEEIELISLKEEKKMAVITAEERAFLLSEMETLLMEYEYSYELDALNAIIDEWSSQKADLIAHFKKHPNYIEGKFMIAFDKDFDRTIDHSVGSKFVRFLAINLNDEFLANLPEEINRKREAEYRAWLPEKLYRMIFDGYIANIVTRELSDADAEVINDAAPWVHAHKGQKTTRVVNKICSYLNMDKFPNYNREFAKYADGISPMTIKRHTVISINPLDYLTMSFGNSWASCHTIDKRNKRNMPNSYEGMYSSGTISYMLDESSIVMYTIDGSYNGNNYWTQPKINRNMFHWSGDVSLVQGRMYPQDNDGNAGVYTPFREIMQKTFSEMYEFPNLWRLERGTSAASRYIESDGTHYKDYEHYENCSLSTIKGREADLHKFVVGAQPICITCGRRHWTDNNISCCKGQGLVCADCCHDIDEDDAIYIDGEVYCRDCVNYCDICECYHRGSSFYIESENRDVCHECLDEYYEYCEHCSEYYERDNMCYVECECRYVCNCCADSYYAQCDDCGELFPYEEINLTDSGYYCSTCIKDHVDEEETA